MAAGRSLLPPRRPRGYRFALTPLADAMFQLLIFFMLASSQVPYSLLTLKAGASPGQGAGDEVAPPGEDAALWSVDAGAVIAGGQRFNFDALPDLAAALVASGVPSVVLLARDGARVQDLVAVTEVLTTAGVPAVQMAQIGRAGASQ